MNGLPSFSWLGSHFDLFFNSPHISIATLAGGFPPHAFFLALSIINLLCFTSMFLGISTKWTSVGFSLTSIVGHNFWYSFGKIDHLLLWLLVPLFMAFAGWGNYFTLRNNKKEPVEKDNSLLIGLLAVCIAFSMFTSGIQKIWGGWLSWRAEAVRYHLIKGMIASGRGGLLAEAFSRMNNHLVWKFFDYSALIMEIGFMVSLFKKRYFQLFLAIAVVFHVMVLLMFNIAFYSNLFAYLLFINWKDIFRLFGWEKRGNILQLQRTTRIVLVPAFLWCLFWICYQLRYSHTFYLPSLASFLTMEGRNSDPSMYFLFTTALIILLIGIFANFKGRQNEQYKHPASPDGAS